MHGVALNVEKKSVDGFLRIVPCGIKDKQVTAIEFLNQESNEVVSVETVAKQIIEAFSAEFEADMITEESDFSRPYLNEPYAIISQHGGISQHV